MSAKSAEVDLIIAGTVWSGWQEVEVTRALDRVAGTFALTLTDRWAETMAPRAIRTGDACVLRLGGEVAITGHVDEVAPSYDVATHTIRVRGRDATADLVDGSAADEPGEWRGLGLAELVAALAGPFAIDVTAAIDVGATIPVFRVQESETAWEAIERACRLRAVLPMSDGRGGLVLTRGGAGGRAGSALARGANIERAEAMFSSRDVFSTITVKAQQAGWDDWDAGGEASPAATVTASGPRHRPLVVLAEDQADAAACHTRALWEARVRAARARAAIYTVVGWQDGGGALWTPNTLVSVADDWLALNGEYLISSVTHRKAAGAGTTAEIAVTGRHAWDVLAIADTGAEEMGW